MKINASRLYVAMANACMTAAEVCDAAGISKPTLINIKSGKQEPKPITLGKIAKVLNVDPEYLIDWDGTNPQTVQ